MSNSTDISLEPDTRYSEPRSFGLFLFGQTVSVFGDSFAEVAMPLLVLSLTGSVAKMGLVAGVSAASQLAGGLAAGPIVERFNRRAPLIVGDLLQMALGAIIPITWWLMPRAEWSRDAMFLILPIVMLSSAISTNYQVGVRSIVPRLVGRSLLTQANSRITLYTEIAFGLGPVVAGVSVSLLGAPVTIGVNAATFGVSAACLAFMRVPRAAGPEPGEQVPLYGFAGLKFLWRDSFLRDLGFLQLGNTLFTAGAISLFVFYVRRDLGQSSIVVGLLMTLGSVGAVLGAVLAGRVRARLGFGTGWLITVAIQGVALAGVSLSGSIWAVAILAVIFAFGQVSGTVLTLTRRQELIPDNLLPKVSAAVITFTIAATSVGTIALTSAASRFGVRQVFVAAGVLTLTVALAGSWTGVRKDASRGSDARLPRRKPWPRPVVLAMALAATTGMLLLGIEGIGSVVPPLGGVLDPVTGVWGGMAAEATAASTQTLRLPGLDGPVRVSFDSAGVPVIDASDAHDAFYAQAYVTTRYRLLQMDLMSAQAGGTLSRILGPQALSSDETELTLGLDRTARALYDSLSASDPSRQALIAYSAGANEAISALESAHQLPTAFTLLNYVPEAWTPLDSLLIQGDLTQTLDFSLTGLDNAVLSEKLGSQRASSWFPVTPVTPQQPYDPGPYQRLPLAQVSPGIPGTSPTPATGSVPATASARPAGQSSPRESAASQAAIAAQSWLDALPSEVHEYSASNAWAVAGSHSADGKAILASDPHLQQTLPSVWYQVVLDAPGLHVSGVSVPGVPGVLIGATPSVTWGITDAQNQSTFFYRETVSSRNPDYYYWEGAWHAFRLVHYAIKVKGSATVNYTVRIGVHGPMFTADGQTAAVWWAGGVPSHDLDALFGLYKAGTAGQVKQALAGWLAPAENFIYATASGDIGIFAPGLYPQVRAGTPWLPLDGTGADDVVGTIPLSAVPQVTNPSDGIVVSANQVPVSASYPYYIGMSSVFDPGYRTRAIREFLVAHPKTTPAQMRQLQGNVTDTFASSLVPVLLTSLQRDGGDLTSLQDAARRMLSGWDYGMTASSGPAAVWWTFLQDYVNAVFGPWWQARTVPARAYGDLALDPAVVFSLDEDLQYWATHGAPADSALTLPDGQRRSQAQLMVSAFRTAVSQLSGKLGADTTTWAWGRLHQDQFTSLTGANALGYGPRGAGGDAFTPDAAYGYPVSTSGPSWRMVVEVGGQASGIYPGGQSEDPLSPWYEDMISTWWQGGTRPMTVPASTGPASSGPVGTDPVGTDPAGTRPADTGATPSAVWTMLPEASHG